MGPGLLPAGNDPDKQALMDGRSQEEALAGLLQMPTAPMARYADEQGAGKVMGKQFLDAMTGGWFRDALFPDYADDKANYAADLALYKKQREMGLIDPQDQALADAIRAGEKGPELMALQAEASGIDKLNLDPYTESPGQIRRDAFGNEISRGGDPVVSPTSVMQNAREIAAGYGISPGSRAYSDLMSALAEPSGTETLADGSTRTFNTVNKVVADWQNGVYGPVQQQGQAGGQAGAPVSDGSISPEDAAIAKGRAARNVHDADNYAISDDKIAFYDDLERVMGNFGTWDPDANDGEGAFTLNDSTADNFGSWDNHPLNPGAYRPFKGTGEKNALVYMEQLIDMLTVDERGKLKGQGQITEGETAMLARATTAARNRDLGDEAVQTELGVLMRQLMKRRQKFMDLQKRYAPERFEGQQDGPTVIDLD